MPYLIDGYNLLHAMGLLGGTVGPHGLEKARAGLLGLVSGTHAEAVAEVTVVFDARHPQLLADKLKAGEPVYLLDVRQPDEHAFAALPNSTLIPLGELPARLGEIQPPPGALVVVYCHHGVRSLRGAAFLRQNGISPVA